MRRERHPWDTDPMEGQAGAIGRRVLVIGMAGSGKSTFSRALSAKTGLPVIHLDLYQWKPGWVRPSEEEWRETQTRVLAGAPGSQTGTTSTRSNFGWHERTPWCFLRHPGGRARPVRSSEGCRSQSARCPKVAKTQPGDVCAMSGDWWESSCATAGPRPNAVAPLSPGMGDMQLRMCSVRSEQHESFSTV